MSVDLLRYRPPRIAMLFLLIATALHWLAPMPVLRLPGAGPVAMTMGLFGFSIMFIAWWQFRQTQVAVCPTEPTAQLIETGLYRYTRNPMYLGMVLMLAAVAVWLGSLPYVAATGIYLYVIDQVFCPYEEDKLSAAFGSQYRDYQQRVRRWL